MTTYEKIEGTDLELKSRVYYNKGGINYATYKNEPRGYYLSVTPVKREHRDNGIVIESYSAFSGIKTLLLEVKRQSPKAEAEANRLAELKLPELKAHVLNNLK